MANVRDKKVKLVYTRKQWYRRQHNGALIGYSGNVTAHRLLYKDASAVL